MAILFVPHIEANNEIANSYLSVADADDIILKQSNSEEWGSLDEPTKQMLLMQSSLAVDGAMMYQGEKTSSNQILKFARDGLLALPQNIKFATAMMALDYSNGEVFKNIKREKISKHETEYFSNSDNLTNGAVNSGIIAFLTPLKAITIKIKNSNSYG
jgi:hypothetical protein